MSQSEGHDVPHPIWNVANRIPTFENWTNPYVKKEDLAEAGFIHIGPEDTVKCVFCYLTVEKWENGDDPINKHRVLNSNCPIVDIISERDRSLVAIQAQKPIFPEYVSKEARRKTFSTWPVTQHPPAEELIVGGFYYKGERDRVQCFQCSLIAECWDDNDDVFLEHIRLSPKCAFVALQKGASFVSNCRPGASAIEDPKTVTYLTPREIIKQALFQEGYPQIFIDYAYFQQRMHGNDHGFTKAEELLTVLYQIPGANSAASARLANPTVKSEAESNFAKLCKVCLQNPGNLMAMPCEDFNCCVHCKDKFKQCPSCQADIYFQ